MSDATHARPASRDAELIPRGLLLAMAGLVLASLSVVSFAVMTDRPTVGQPAAAPVVAERMVRLVGGGAKAVSVTTPEGALLADLAHGGFVTVVQNGLQTARQRHGIDPALPVRLVRYENGRFALEDPETGWSVELYAFGDGNEAAFARLMTN